MDKQLKYSSEEMAVFAPVASTSFEGHGSLPLEFDERSGEVARIKSLEVSMSLNVPGAGYGVAISSYVCRHEVPDFGHGSLRTFRPSDVLDRFSLEDTDSFGDFDQRYTPSRRQCPRFIWPDGMEPFILYRRPSQILVHVWVNTHPAPPSDIIVVANYHFRYWVERPTDKEYERLARAYGRVS